MELLVLGSGQDIGKSCILVSCEGAHVLLDCGIHLGDSNNRLPRLERLPARLDAVLLTHLHLDHIGALPVLVHKHQYTGVVVMSPPTRALAPSLLRDCARFMDQELVEYYEHQQVTRALDNALLVHHGQSVRVSHNIQVTAFYAGHVIGALMYLIEINGKRVFFTGDFNFTPDRHLGAAKPPRIYTDVVISESTYSDVVMDSKKLRERQLIEQVTKCLAGGGKVLFPVYAVGRAQELCMILESAWESLPKDSRVPLYFTRGIAAQANAFYKAFVSWTCDDVKRISLTKSVFDFSHIEEISVHDIKMKSGPMIIFATPAMLHSGTSLEIFKFLAPDERNLVVLAGLCVKGTLGHEMMSGKKQITIKDEKISVKCTISRISFSAHTDSKGIIQMVKRLNPKKLVLVHGEKSKMFNLKDFIETEMKIPTFVPENDSVVRFEDHFHLVSSVSGKLSAAFDACLRRNEKMKFHAVMLKSSYAQNYDILSEEETKHLLNLNTPKLRYKFRIPIPPEVIVEKKRKSILALHYISSEFQKARMDFRCTSEKELDLENVSIIEEELFMLFTWEATNEEHAMKARFLIKHLLQKYENTLKNAQP